MKATIAFRHAPFDRKTEVAIIQIDVPSAAELWGAVVGAVKVWSHVCVLRVETPVETFEVAGALGEQGFKSVSIIEKDGRLSETLIIASRDQAFAES